MFPIVLLLSTKFFPFSWFMSLWFLLRLGLATAAVLHFLFEGFSTKHCLETKNILDYSKTWYWKEQVEVFVADVGLQHEVSTFFHFFLIPMLYHRNTNSNTTNTNINTNINTVLYPVREGLWNDISNSEVVCLKIQSQETTLICPR